MKLYLIAIFFFMLTAPFVNAQSGASSTSSQLRLMNDWPPESTVSVYFFRHMFTPAQRGALLDSMADWASSIEGSGARINFRNAGETDGLIDCQSCLTVARQEVNVYARSGRTTFNALRRNQMGQLISAWIGIERESRHTANLRGFMLQALGGRSIR